MILPAGLGEGEYVAFLTSSRALGFHYCSVDHTLESKRVQKQEHHQGGKEEELGLEW